MRQRSSFRGDRCTTARGGVVRFGAGRRLAIRRGLTLMEMLVVLVLMAISAALVVPAIRPPSNDAAAADGSAQAGLIQTPEVDGVVATARRLAIKRGEPMRLRVATDGVWGIVAMGGGESVQNGRVTKPLSWQPDLIVDAIGTCVLSNHVAPLAGAIAWDALACRWRGASDVVLP